MTLSRDLLLLDIVVLVLQKTTAYSDTWRTMEFNNRVPSQEIKRGGPGPQTTFSSGSDGIKTQTLTPQEKIAFTQLLSAAGVRLPQPADTVPRQDRQNDDEESDSDWHRPFGVTISDSDTSDKSNQDYMTMNFGRSRRPRKPANTPASVTTDWMNMGNNPELIRKILDRGADALLNERKNNFEETLPHDRRPKRNHYHSQRSQDHEGHNGRHRGHRYRHYHENRDRYNGYEDRDRYSSDEDRDRYYSDEDRGDYDSDEDDIGYYSDEDRGHYGSDEDEDRAYDKHSNHMPQKTQKWKPVRQSRRKKHLLNIDLDKMIGGGIKNVLSSLFSEDSIFGSFGADGTGEGSTKTGMQASDRSGPSVTDALKKLASKGEQLVKEIQSWKRNDDTWGKGTTVDDSQDSGREEDWKSNGNDNGDHDDTDTDREDDEENDEEDNEEEEEGSEKEDDEEDDEEKNEEEGDEEENKEEGENDKEGEEEEEDDTEKEKDDDDDEEEDKNEEDEDENEKEEDEGEETNEGEEEEEEDREDKEEEEEEGDNAYDSDRSGFESYEDSDMSPEDRDFDDEDRYFHYEDRDLDYGDIYFDYGDSDANSHENYFDFEEQDMNGKHYKNTGTKQMDTNSENRNVAHSDNGRAKKMKKEENQNSNKDRKYDEEAANALKWLTKRYTPLHDKLFNIGAKKGFQDRMLVAPMLPLPDNTVEEGIIGPDGSFHTELVTYFRRRR